MHPNAASHKDLGLAKDHPVARASRGWLDIHKAEHSSFRNILNLVPDPIRSRHRKHLLVPSRLQVTSATFPHQPGKPSRPNWGNWMELNRTSQGSQQLGGALKQGNQLLLYTCLHWFVLIMIDVLDVWAGFETFVDWLHWLVQCGFSPWDCDDPDKARLHYTHHSTSQALGHCKSLLQISCQLVSFLQGPFKCKQDFPTVARMFRDATAVQKSWLPQPVVNHRFCCVCVFFGLYRSKNMLVFGPCLGIGYRHEIGHRMFSQHLSSAAPLGRRSHQPLSCDPWGLAPCRAWNPQIRLRNPLPLFLRNFCENQPKYANILKICTMVFSGAIL